VFSASSSARRTLSAFMAIGCATTLCLTTVPAEALTHSAVSTAVAAPSDAGLFGAADPTYTGVYRQSLSLLAFEAAGVTPPGVAVDWLLSQRCADGGFQGYTTSSLTCTAPDSTNYAGEDTNTTAVALQALSALGQKAAAQAAADWLIAHQNTDQGFGYYPDQVANPSPSGSAASDANSTAMVLMGLNAFNTYVANLPTPGVPYTAQADAAKGFLQTLQPATCPPETLTNEGAFEWQPGLAGFHYATVQASFAISGHVLTDAPFAVPNIVEPTFNCANPPVIDPYDPALVSAGYISRWIDLAGSDSFTGDPSDEPAWAALSLIASGVLPQSSIDTALQFADAAAAASRNDAGDIAMDILARHAQPGGATDSQIPVLMTRLRGTLAPVNVVAPKVTGIAKVGQMVTCDLSSWKKGPVSRAYAWYSGTTRLSTAYALTLTPALVTKSVRCAVTATNSFGSTAATSAPVKVLVGTLANTVLPTIDGTARAGRKLHATSGTWNPTATSTKYVWKIGTTVVGRGSTYTIQKTDKGKRLVVVVTVSRAVNGSTAYVGTATSKSRIVR